MERNNLNKYIGKKIVLAQVASDGGKGERYVLSHIAPLFPISRLYYQKGYNIKDNCIIAAIKAIQKNPKCGFKYSVKVDRTLLSGSHVFIVYFNFKINNENYQISFHTFSNMWKFVNKKCITRWKKRVSSRDAAIRLAYAIYTNSSNDNNNKGGLKNDKSNNI